MNSAQWRREMRQSMILEYSMVLLSLVYWRGKTFCKRFYIVLYGACKISGLCTYDAYLPGGSMFRWWGYRHLSLVINLSNVNIIFLWSIQLPFFNNTNILRIPIVAQALSILLCNVYCLSVYFIIVLLQSPISIFNHIRMIDLGVNGGLKQVIGIRDKGNEVE